MRIVEASDPSTAADAASAFPPDILAEAAESDAGAKMLMTILRHGSGDAWLSVLRALAATTASTLKHCKDRHANRVMRMLITGIREYDVLYNFANAHLEELADDRYGTLCLDEAVFTLDAPRQTALAQRILELRPPRCRFTRLCLEFFAAGQETDRELFETWTSAPGKFLRSKFLRAMCKRFPLFSVNDDRLADGAFALRALYACAPAMHEACYCDAARANLKRAMRRLSDEDLCRFLGEEEYARAILQLDAHVEWHAFEGLDGKPRSREMLRRPVGKALEMSWPVAFTFSGVNKIIKYARGRHLDKVARSMWDARIIRKLACDAIAVALLNYLCDRSDAFRERLFDAMDEMGDAGVDIAHHYCGASLLVRVTARWHREDGGPYSFVARHLDALAQGPNSSRVVLAVFRYAPAVMERTLRELYARLGPSLAATRHELRESLLLNPATRAAAGRICAVRG